VESLNPSDHGGYHRAPTVATEPNGRHTMQKTPSIETELEAAAFRQLLKHLDEHREVQNIDLMNTAGFCRNCLAKWYRAAALERGVEISDEAARERIYGMPYAEWKARFQK
jgi:hypothetical protein